MRIIRYQVKPKGTPRPASPCSGIFKSYAIFSSKRLYMNYEGSGLGFWVFIIVIILLFSFLGIPRFLQPKYQGQTAEDWFNNYKDELAEKNQCIIEKDECFDDQPNTDIKELVDCITKVDKSSAEIVKLCVSNKPQSQNGFVQNEDGSWSQIGNQEILSPEEQWKWSESSQDWIPNNESQPNTLDCVNKIAPALLSSMKKEKFDCFNEYIE